jgi:pimeloyl-ACP methyl ester carboxylesterase
VIDAIRTYEQASNPGDKIVYENFLSALTNQGSYKEYDVKRHPERLTFSGCDSSQKSNNPNLFVFYYDWRQSNADAAAALKEYVRCIQDFYPGTDVDIVAHSQGGLVARRYVLDNPTSHHVKKMITVGTPWLGAPRQ